MPHESSFETVHLLQPSLIDMLPPAPFGDVYTQKEFRISESELSRLNNKDHYDNVAQRIGPQRCANLLLQQCLHTGQVNEPECPDMYKALAGDAGVNPAPLLRKALIMHHDAMSNAFEVAYRDSGSEETPLLHCNNAIQFDITASCLVPNVKSGVKSALSGVLTACANTAHAYLPSKKEAISGYENAAQGALTQAINAMPDYGAQTERILVNPKAYQEQHFKWLETLREIERASEPASLAASVVRHASSSGNNSVQAGIG